jgi:hypothetical protein
MKRVGACILCCFWLMLIVFLGPSLADELATLTGYLTDPNGLKVPRAKVQATNIETNVSHFGETNEEGLYRISGLPTGTYRVVIQRAGFKTIVKQDLELHVQDVVALNFQLEVGSVAESVTVEAGAPLINTESASVSTLVDRQFAENLPMNGRSFQTLIQLTPGVVLTPSNGSDGGQFSVNGQRAASNYWMVDGVSANIGIGVTATLNPGNGLVGSLGSFSALGGTNSLVSVDAMQEFRIQTSTYAPEFGRTPGGQISILTRSGTNQLHGTVFDYLRNDIFDANNWFNTSVTPQLHKAEERQNDFGGTLSGRILKDRTFFFFSYEGLRLRLPQTALTTVPDAGFTPGGTTNSRQNATAPLQQYLNAYPLPNPNSPEIFVACDPTADPTCPPAGQKATGSAALNTSYSNPATLDAYSLRIDHKLGTTVTLFGRYNYSPSQFTDRGGSALRSPLSVLQPIRITTQTVTGGATWMVSPSISNDLRFNYSRTNSTSRYLEDTFAGAVPLTSLPIPSPFTSNNGLFQFSIESLPQGALYFGQLGQNLQRQVNVVDSLSMQKGSHGLKFGADFRRLSPLYGATAYIQDAFFADVLSAQSGGLERSIVGTDLTTTFLFRNLGLYAQDTWRVIPRLTVTYGLRWDVDFVPQSINGPSLGRVTGFDLNNFSQLALAPAGTSPYDTTYGNFAPRLGVAFQVSQKQDRQMVLRGGLGLFYDLASSEVGNEITPGNFPFGSIAFSSGGTFPLTPALSAPPPITPPSASNSQTLFAFNPHLELPYTLEWNVALEQVLGKQQTISASYIGAEGRRLLQTSLILSPNPNLASAQLVTNAGTSDYNALQIQFERRLSRGLQALASYTWSHSIDTGSAGSTGLASNALVPSASNANRGASDFDIRHAFSAAVTYDVPTPKSSPFVNSILRGWSLQNIIQARSAPPVDVSDVAFFSLNGGVLGDIRPDSVPGQALYLYGPQYPGRKAFNPAAFTDPPFDPATFIPTRQGNLPRNALRGFGATQWDLAVHRDFPIHESLKLQFRAEMFNVLNHPNFGPPSTFFVSPALGGPNPGFGVSNQMLAQSLSGSNQGGGALSPLYQIGGPRSVQLALKLFF